MRSRLAGLDSRKANQHNTCAHMLHLSEFKSNKLGSSMCVRVYVFSVKLCNASDSFVCIIVNLYIHQYWYKRYEEVCMYLFKLHPIETMPHNHRLNQLKLKLKLNNKLLIVAMLPVCYLGLLNDICRIRIVEFARERPSVMTENDGHVWAKDMILP